MDRIDRIKAESSMKTESIHAFMLYSIFFILSILSIPAISSAGKER